MQIGNNKWNCNERIPRGGRYRKGLWGDELKLAYGFLSENGVSELKTRHCNRKVYGYDWARGWIPINGTA